MRRLWLLFILPMCFQYCQSLETVFSWKELDFQFPNESIRNTYIATGDYIQENNLPNGLSIWKNKMFVTVPRWKKGVPSNLNYILLDNENQNKSPKLIPYPDLESNDVHNQSNNVIVSIFRTRVDACDRLWGLDTGVEDILGNSETVRPARLIVIDLKTDKIIRTYALKETDKKPVSFFANILVDVDKDSCDEAFAYIPDFTGYGLVVYSWAENNSWRVHHNYFYFDPLHGDYNVSGVNFQWTDGVFGMSLSKVQPDGTTLLYFHAMSGITEFAVPTFVLKNETLATIVNNVFFSVVGDKGPLSQGPTTLVDYRNDIAYFTQINRHGVACWDTSVPLSPNSFRLVLDDKERLIFPNDMDVDESLQKLYVLSSNVPKYQIENLDKTHDNYVITSASLNDLRKLCKFHKV